MLRYTVIDLICSEKIYFDGALPLSKRPTRLDRLEKTRVKLEQLCKNAPKTFKEGRAKLPFDESKTTDKIMATTKVFDKSSITPSKFLALPDGAPFMVAAVLEDLQTLTWSALKGRIMGFVTWEKWEDVLGARQDDQLVWPDLAEIIVGEADTYCALRASKCGGHILTGDSDLLIHDLAGQGKVIFFESIEATFSVTDDGFEHVSDINVSSFDPAGICQKLGLINLRVLGFEMKRDPHTATTILVEKAKKGILPQDLSEFREFEQDYLNPDIDAHSQPKTTLDPRISELVAQFTHSEFQPPEKSATIFFPIVTEDHSRAAIWSYSTRIRQIGYSILMLSRSSSSSNLQAVTECYRRGSRIGNIQIDPLDVLTTATSIKSLTARLAEVRTGAAENVRQSAAYWQYIAVAELLDALGEELQVLPPLSHLRNIFNPPNPKSVITWNEIRLLGQIHTVLYSFRILKQLATLSLQSGVIDDPSLRTAVADLTKSLSDLPPLTHLMKSRRALQMMISPAGPRTSNITAITIIYRRAEAKVEAAKRAEAEFDSEERKVSNSEASTSENEEGDDLSDPEPILPQPKKQKQDSGNVLVNARNRRGGRKQHQQQRNNPFEMLRNR